MNIAFHYYTIKTLAHYAGFDDASSQVVAHFSQQIDDYILEGPFITRVEPPDFFLKNGLACKYGKNQWVLSPCPTGINTIRTISHNYQLHTLMPFHFIMTNPYPAMKNVSDRSLLRCKAAMDDDSLFINRLLDGMVNKADVHDKTSLMALGMLLHTYSDSFAHCQFSGFHGWENEFYVAKMIHKQPSNLKPFPFPRLNPFSIIKWFDKQTSNEAMSPVEIAFYRSLPSIGHSNVGHAPDCPDCSITLYGKKTKDGKMLPLIERDNGKFFSKCSKRILSTLCRISGKPFPDDVSWNRLERKLEAAQNVRDHNNKKGMKKKWSDTFPDIKYQYTKNDYINVRFHLLYHDEKLLNRLNVDKSFLSDMYSEQGEQARAASLMLAEEMDEWFFHYNELAYRHVYAVTGEYASVGNAAKLSAYCNLANQLGVS